jgi:gluconate 2-dehydrogenase gamma chain
MNRRDSLKAIGLSVSTVVLLDACKTTPDAKTKEGKPTAEPGRQDYEVVRDKHLQTDRYFTDHELATITVLADIIIPRDEHSGSASDAKVTDFIEFIVKDEPEHALPMRGGLRWLDVKCLNIYGNEFKSCTSQQQEAIVSKIAYPMQATPDMLPGVTFFNKMRELTAIGFFTSKIGIADLGYKGNSPGKWEGVPADVLKQYGLEGV